jgi:hypothetical protein
MEIKIGNFFAPNMKDLMKSFESKPESENDSPETADKVHHFLPLIQGVTKMYCGAINTPSWDEYGRPIYPERFTIHREKVTCPACKEKLKL